jgi:hypothetical protein
MIVGNFVCVELTNAGETRREQRCYRIELFDLGGIRDRPSSVLWSAETTSLAIPKRNSISDCRSSNLSARRLTKMGFAL